MLESIRALFRGPTADQGPTPGVASPDVNPVHVAACALLLDVAWADGEYSAPEQQHMADVLARHFGLSPDAAARLLAVAGDERRKAIDHFQFTRVLQSSYDLGQKMVLAEVMWGLALADGKVADNEQYLTRKICNLLDLEPAYLSSAKAAAEKARNS